MVSLVQFPFISSSVGIIFPRKKILIKKKGNHFCLPFSPYHSTHRHSTPLPFWKNMVNIQTAIDSTMLALAIVGNCIALEGVLMGKITMICYRRFLASLLFSSIYICFFRAIYIAVAAGTDQKGIKSSQADDNQPELFGISVSCIFVIQRFFEMVGYYAFLMNLGGMFLDHFVAIVIYFF